MAFFSTIRIAIFFFFLRISKKWKSKLIIQLAIYLSEDSLAYHVISNTVVTFVGYGALRGVSSVLKRSGSPSSGFSTIDSEYCD